MPEGRPELIPFFLPGQGTCRRCPLARRVVPGAGWPSRLMLVGEAPGAREEELGLPFVGPAGRLLDELLAELGLNRAILYVTNVVKCRPPGNRTPFDGEVAACRFWLDLELAILRPRVVVALGDTAARFFVPRPTRGLPYACGSFFVVPTYHPAYLLRGRYEKRADVARHLALAMSLLERGGSSEPRAMP